MILGYRAPLAAGGESLGWSQNCRVPVATCKIT